MDKNETPILESSTLTAWALFIGGVPWGLYEITGGNWSDALIYLAIGSVGGLYLLWRRDDWKELGKLFRAWRSYFWS